MVLTLVYTHMDRGTVSQKQARRKYTHKGTEIKTRNIQTHMEDTNRI